MSLYWRRFFQSKYARLLSYGLVLLLIMTLGVIYSQTTRAEESGKKLITVYDRGEKSAFLTDAKTIGEALKKNDVALDDRDTVEPSRSEELVAQDYQVNIYRARPVVVVDGNTRVKIMTPYQTAKHIAKDADITVYDEDIALLQRSTDFIGDGAGLQLVIKRATIVNVDLYGRQSEIRTQAKTIAEFLKEKNIVLGVNGRVSLPQDTPISAGMNIRVWREGKQTITVDQPVEFETEQIFDADREVGYRAVQTPGVLGVKSVSYEIEIKEGVETSRQEIAQIVTKAPVKEILVVGIKSNPNSLTKSKGAQYFTDSKGVSHRETYYDLNMSVVMRSCGQGGQYTVRVDGAKIDADGYVIVAANYGNYPKCSVVETSMGPGKVYDTGGFAARHPHGFDLATDWTRADGI